MRITEQSFQEKSFEVMRFTIQRRFAMRGINYPQIFVERASDMTEELLARIDVKMPAEELFEVKIESSWWQAFKKKHFPQRLLLKFPVRYQILKGFLLHPEIAIKPTDNNIYYAVNKMTAEH